MATGIVSIGLFIDRRTTISRALFAVAALVWVLLGLIVVRRILRDRARLVAEARSPAGLTGVAATAVLGTRVLQLGWSTIGIALLVLAACAWPLLMPAVARRLHRRASGDWFMLTVATEGVAGLAAELAVAEHARWLLAPALALAVLGLLWLAGRSPSQL
jgi:hypothetical protein